MTAPAPAPAARPGRLGALANEIDQVAAQIEACGPKIDQAHALAFPPQTPDVAERIDANAKRSTAAAELRRLQKERAELMRRHTELRGQVTRLMQEREQRMAHLAKLEAAWAEASDLLPKLEAAVAAIEALPRKNATLRQAWVYLAADRDRCAGYPRQIAVARRELEALGDGRATKTNNT